MKRHDIDNEVINFVFDKFNKGFNTENSFSYIYVDENIKIEISRMQVIKPNEKIVVNLFKMEGETKFDLKTTKHINHKLSIESSDILRKFIEDKEDEVNKDYIRNKSNEVLELINNS